MSFAGHGSNKDGSSRFVICILSCCRARVNCLQLKGQPGAWSAPVFFTIKSLGIGASAGFSSSHTVLVLDNEKSVNDFLHTQVHCRNCSPAIVNAEKTGKINLECRFGDMQEKFACLVKQDSLAGRPVDTSSFQLLMTFSKNPLL